MSDRPMTWDEFCTARQTLAEMKVGRHLRAEASKEDAAFEAAAAALRKRGA